MERRILVGVILVLALIAAITTAIILPTAEEKAKMPALQVGDEWVYRSTDDITYTFHYKVIDEEMVDDGDSYVFETSYDPPYLGINSGGTRWVKKTTGDTIKEQRSYKYTGFPYTRTSTYTYQYSGANKWPIEVGKEYSVTGTVTYTTSPSGPTGTETQTSTVKVEKRENVTVPAGTFTCFEIVYYDENGDIWITSWYSDNVKRYVKAINNETGETTELVSYSIREGSLVISGPMELEVDDEAMFTVTSRGSSVENALVEVDGKTENSRADGTVTFVFDQLGDFTVTATKEGYEGASIPITVKAPPENAPHYEVVGCVNRINDGDTIEVGVLKLVTELDPEAEISEGTWERVRFGGGIDAPEYYELGYSEATDFVENLIPLRTTVYLDLDNLAMSPTDRPYRGTYERLIAVIYAEIDGQWVNINAELLRWGMEAYPSNDWDEYTWIESEFDMYEWPPYDNNYPHVLS